MLTLYLRREPCEPFPDAPGAPPARSHDVAAYADAGATQRKGKWAWWNSRRPDRRNKWATLNCYRYRVQWLPDAEGVR